MNQSRVSKVSTLPRSDKVQRSLRTIPTERSTLPDERLGVSVVIPAYNEEGSVAESVAEIHAIFASSNYDVEIIVVDDGSKDMTAREAKRAGARVLQHRSNRGYGASLKTGIVAASHNTIAITDADGTYPAEY